MPPTFCSSPWAHAAWLVPLALGVYSARYVVLKPIAHPGWVGLGYTVLVVTSAGLLSLGFGEVPFDQLPLPAGGALGQLLSTGLARYFNVPGAGLLLGAGFLSAAMFTVNFSLYSFWDRFRLAVLGVLRRIQAGRTIRREQRLKRQTREEQEPQRAKARKQAPEIVSDKQVEVLPRSRHAVQETFDFALEIDGYRMPPLDLLDPGAPAGAGPDEESLLMASRVLEKKLADFGVQGRVETVRPGPVITMYEFKPAPGIKINQIVNRADDLALTLRALRCASSRRSRARTRSASRSPTTSARWSPSGRSWPARCIRRASPS